jgi:Big-like domain-containing protein
VKQTILGIFVAITAMACGGSSSSSSDTPVSPGGPTPLTLRIAGSAELNKKGETAQLNAFVGFSDGATVDKTGSASWVSTKPGVATVSTTGMVTAVEDGNSVITATFQTIAGSMTVIVDLPIAPSH